jgi:hypothetical protein
MELTNILSFLCGSLVATMVCTFFIYRQMILDERTIRHIRSASYNKGWADGKESKFKGE